MPNSKKAPLCDRRDITNSEVREILIKQGKRPVCLTKETIADVERRCKFFEDNFKISIEGGKTARIAVTKLNNTSCANN